MRTRVAALAAALLLTIGSRARAETVLTLDGEVPAGDDLFFTLPFDVPAGTVEIEIRHDDLSDQNILDWGLNEPSGAFRGWGGGNVEPAIVGLDAASRSYLRGPIPPGTWSVQVGKAKIKESPALYHVEVVLRSGADALALAPQPERAPYVAAPALTTGARWYAGDFHVHSRESGDASPTLDDVAAFARGRGLDFVELSDHNTVSQLDFLVDAQSRHPDLLLLPGVEFTTYQGHANGIGATVWVDHKIGLPGVTIEAAGQAFADQGAILSINHPVLDLGDLCIGCAWEHDLAPELVGAVEIETGGWSQSGFLFTEKAITFWDLLLNTGRHAPAIGGSDDHKGGTDEGSFQSPLGDPTTLVYATELSVAGILDGIRSGRTVVKLQGPDDPMIDLDASIGREGDTIAAHTVTFRATVTGGAGDTFRFVQNGFAQETVAIDADPFVAEVTATAPASGEDRWRAEVLVDDDPRTVTSHIWLKDGPAGTKADVVGVEGGGCGCRAAGGPSGWGLVVGAAAAAALASARRGARARARERLYSMRSATAGSSREARHAG